MLSDSDAVNNFSNSVILLEWMFCCKRQRKIESNRKGKPRGKDKEEENKKDLLTRNLNIRRNEEN